jgi:acetolactate synthase-1/2/3 large subunit
MRHGGEILVGELEAQGVDTVFCVPGESYLAALDGLHDSNRIRTIVCRQEGGAAMMADADARLTGKPGVCFVTRGPGATNASIGVHIAQQDSNPMVMFVGLPDREMVDREAFQEFDLNAVFRALGKGSEVVADARRIPEYVSRAFHKAVSGRPGPVIVGLPEDVLSSRLDVAQGKAAMPALAAPAASDMARLEALLERAERPVAIVGGPGWSAAAKSDLEAAASALDLPVAAAFRFQDYFDNRHPCYAGHVGIGIDPRLADAIRRSDLLIVIGARLGEMTTQGYELIVPPFPGQTLVHVHPSGDELGRVYRAELAINSSTALFAAALKGMKLKRSGARAEARKAAHAAYEAFIEPLPVPGSVQMAEVVKTLERVVPEDAILSNGAGNYTAWVHRFYRYKHYRTELAPSCGAMGYGLPAAVAAKLRHPERAVIAFAGDGCFLMNGQELATAAQYGANVVSIVVNNGMYGTIRMHQERSFPGRVSGTSLKNPDFAALARSYGCHGETVEETAAFESALRRSLDAGRPALIEVRIDPEALTPRQSLSEVRAAAHRQG